MQDIYKKIYNRETLTQQDSTILFNGIMAGDIDDNLLISILTALQIRGETADEIAGAVSALLQHARAFPRPNYKIGEIVGTGGDGHNTINISSAAALVGAGYGLKICKHGNRKATSKSGSADAFSELGFCLEASGEDSRKLVDELGICFLMAPQYHPALKRTIKVRQILPCRTIFNILGPLLNPARPDYILNGVFDTSLLSIIADAHIALGVKRGIVVHGGGLDEVSLHAPTDCVEFFADGTTKSYTVSPEDFGLPPISLQDIKGGSPQENANVIYNIASGSATQAQTDVVCANVAMLLRAGDIEHNLKQGVDMAKSAIKQGKVKHILDSIRAK